MDENKKNEFDALKEMEKGSWAEFQEKTKLEWRLSYAIWTVIVAAVGSIIAGKATGTKIEIPKEIIIFLCVLPLIIHLLYLYWIQTCLRKSRYILNVIRDKMWTLVSITNPTPPSNPWYRQYSLWVQLGITLFLVIILVVAIVYVKPIPKEKSPSKQTISNVTHSSQINKNKLSKSTAVSNR